MRAAIFDPFCGVAGNMILGALIDAGVEVPRLKKMLRLLPLEGEWDLSVTPVSRGGLRGLLVSVDVSENSPDRDLSSIRNMIDSSSLPEAVKLPSISCFERLARAEAEVHGVDVEEVHFHETGAVDAIVDIVGSFCALDLLGIERVYSSPVAIGTGTVQCSHGVLPLPAPATMKLLLGVPIAPSGIKSELTTPTGAAILVEAVSSWEETPPPARVTSTGMGAGTAELHRSNLLRVSLCDSHEENPAWINETCVQIKAVMDDMDMRTWPELSRELQEAGAYDCYMGNCIGRKGRPSLEMTILCSAQTRDEVIERIFRSSPTLGVRVQEIPRAVLERSFISVHTEWGPVSVKVGYLAGEPVNAEPEYSDCVRLARENSVETVKVISTARAAALRVLRGEGPEA